MEKKKVVESGIKTTGIIAFFAKKRIIVSALIIAIAIAVSSVAVVAYTTQDFSTSGKAQFEANNKISATVYLQMTNAGKEVELENNQLEIIGSEQSEDKYIELDKQRFVGAGSQNAIEYIFKITNNNNIEFSVIMNPIAYQDNIITSQEFYLIDTNGSQTNAESGVSIKKDQSCIIKIRVYMEETKETEATINMRVVLQ